MAYGAEFQRFIEPARAKPQLWRFIVGLVVMTLVYIGIVAALTLAVVFGLGMTDISWLASEAAFQNPWVVLWLLATFAGMALGAVAAARWLHGRKAGTLFGRAPRVLREFVLTGGVFLVLGGLPALAFVVLASPDPGLSLTLWLSFLPLALIGIGLQTLAEEMLFRGYIMQQLAARFASPVIWMGGSSLIFALLHFDPRLGPAAVGVILVTGMFGLVAADLTARTGNLGAAWGFHFANNLIGILILSADARLSGLALFRTKVDLAETGFPVGVLVLDAILVAIGWFVARRLLRR